MAQIDSATITKTFDTLEERARRHVPGGMLLAADKPGLIKRTASLCGTTPEAVNDALAHRHDAAKPS